MVAGCCTYTPPPWSPSHVAFDDVHFDACIAGPQRRDAAAAPAPVVADDIVRDHERGVLGVNAAAVFVIGGRPDAVVLDDVVHDHQRLG
jgi:hypothetical protein